MATTYKKITIDNTKVQVDSAIRDGDGANIANNYPKKSGYYEGLKVGQADNLKGSINLEKTEFFSTIQDAASGSDVSIESGKADLQKLIGNSIVWNQQFGLGTPSTTRTAKGLTIDYDSSTRKYHIYGTLTESGNVDITCASATTKPLLKNHYHLYKGFINIIEGISSFYVNGQPMDNIRTAEGVILGNYNGNTWGGNIMISFNSAGVGQTYDFYVGPFQIFDLTLMFGNNDRIPTQFLNGITENGVSISGTTCFNRMFPLPYYEYNAGEIIHSQANQYKVVGYNAFDGVFQTLSSPTIIKSQNFIEVIPGQKYTFEVAAGTQNINNISIVEYDGAQNVIGFTSSSNLTISGFLSNNTHYVKLEIDFDTVEHRTTNITACFHLTWSGSKTGQEPHIENTYNLPNLELKGVNGVGDELLPNGSLTARYAVIDLGDLDWIKHEATETTQEWWRANTRLLNYPEPKLAGYSSISNILCSKYLADSNLNVEGTATTNKATTIDYNNYNKTILKIRDTDFSSKTASEVKTLLTGVKLIYEVATPTTTATTNTFQEVTSIYDYGTQQITRVSGINVPSRVLFSYENNLQNFLQRLYTTNSGNPDNIATESDITSLDTRVTALENSSAIIIDLTTIITMDTTNNELNATDLATLNTILGPYFASQTRLSDDFFKKQCLIRFRQADGGNLRYANYYSFGSNCISFLANFGEWAAWQITFYLTDRNPITRAVAYKRQL